MAASIVSKIGVPNTTPEVNGNRPIVFPGKKSDAVANAALLKDNTTKGRLTLQNGMVITGSSFGAQTSVSGELVFNTGMVGYPEALTDPSYRGQILVLTYPLVGNYGVPNHKAVDEFGLPRYFESERIQVAGLIVAEYNADHSHWNSASSLGEWLEAAGVPALYDVDTRMLTKVIRETGAMLAKIEFGTSTVKLEDPNLRHLVAEVSLKEPRVFNPGNVPRIIAYDCGIKYNIIRCLAQMGAQITVVPYDYDITGKEDEFDGIFVSNGPGDPSMCNTTIESLRKVIQYNEKAEAMPGHSYGNSKRLKPIFGICLGSQLLALAAGAKTFKMKYGNRGMNQPAVDMRTMRCYITPQNHGYAVDTTTLPTGWRPLFINANDNTNEGIIHTHLPFFSAQFHPEANGGPLDTAFLFDMFLEQVRGKPPSITTVDTSLFIQRTRMRRKVLLLGSGGLSIGQAGEFDYSGSQAIKALKEESVEVVLINPNIATVQTSKGMADKVYFLPVTHEFVVEVIRKERPDAIVISMGGQTALNVGVQLEEAGDLERYGVTVLGTPVSAIKATEDREAFAKLLAEIGETAAACSPATTVEDAVKAAARIGYPVLVRAAYALGGLGSGFAHNEAELRDLATRAFAASPQILIDQDLRGWKEIEYEVVRDANDNCITVCNMENFDPLGVHTGDSIVVAPSQTLSNTEYYKLRRTALKVIRRLGVIGECNIQFALNPVSESYCIIEVNARLSRSSALASKATGYPLAYIAAKLALGHDLVTLRNSVTKTTTACFEPSLDYVVVKMPRWDLKKFGSRVDHSIGSAMKSVGEVMAIGRTFEEAIQKAVRMVNPSLDGFGPPPNYVADWAADVNALPANSNGVQSPDICDSEASSPLPATDVATDQQRLLEVLDRRLRIPSDTRLADIGIAFDVGYSVERVQHLTKIDRWFLTKLKRLMDMRHALDEKRGALHTIDAYAMRTLKRNGFSDKAIARHIGVTEMQVREHRIAAGVLPFVKQIDTLAAEFPAQTNYLYMTYHGCEHDVAPANEGVMVLGNGAYCIGSSVEFDWCAVSCVRTLRANNIKAFVVNYNPETVSTDYDESDRLYFEELTLERTLDIYQREHAEGVIVSVGGQIPNNLAMALHNQKVRIFGTSPVDIDRAEDRNKFSKLLDTLKVDQPLWRELSSANDAVAFAEEVGYPVVVRPSYVLSGAAMRVAIGVDQLRSSLAAAAIVSAEHPVVVSKFIVNAKEVEFDAVAVNGKVLNYAISEHVENAGVHSGDATLLLPAQKLYVETIRQVKRISQAIARELSITGPFNIQFMSRENEVKVIECNLRASRTFPFISKTFDFNFIALATKAMVGLPCRPGTFSLVDQDFVGVKAPQFSFARLQGADPTLGVEMMSTGEVACFGVDMYEAFLLSIISAGFKLPNVTRNILISVGDTDKPALIECARRLQLCSYNLFATEGTRKYLLEHEIECVELAKPRGADSASALNVLDYVRQRKLDLVIVIPEAGDRELITDGYTIRRTAIDFGVPLITNVKMASLLSLALERVKTFHIKSMEEFYSTGGATGV